MNNPQNVSLPFQGSKVVVHKKVWKWEMKRPEREVSRIDLCWRPVVHVGKPSGHNQSFFNRVYGLLVGDLVIKENE